MTSLRNKVIGQANPLRGTKVTPPTPVAQPPKQRTPEELASLDSMEEMFDISQLDKPTNITPV